MRFGGRAQLGLIGLLYFTSGALGLVYEVAFGKYLGYIFGATAYASSAVLVAFMAGLALGAAVASRFDKSLRRPLVAYGVAEILIGVFCEAVPLSFDKLSAAYVGFAESHPDALGAITVVRGLMAMGVVLVPAAGMGATLPLLARFIEGREPARSRRLLARLYAINTFGGATGSLMGAYVIVPALGLARTMHVSAALSLAIGFVAIAAGWERPDATAPKASAPAPAPRSNADAIPGAGDALVPMRDALVLAGASGFLVFASEVIFVHLLALVIGTSVYAFGLMLAIFLVCLAAGTPLATRLAERWGKSAIAISFSLTGLALAASLLIWDKLPSLFVSLGPFVRTWHGRELVRGLSAFVALVVPVVAMGTSFPLVLRAVRANTVGADVGKLTVSNTLGSIGGSVVSGFVLLPALGSQRSLLTVALVYAGFGIFAARRSAGAERRRLFGLAAAALVAVVAVPRWDLARLTNGANVYFDEGVVPKGEVEAMWEDVHGGVTTVVHDPATGVRTLLTNGKFQGNDGPEVKDNRGFAHLPVLFAKKRERAMVIGLGTGTSAGTMAAYDFSLVDAVELSPAIIETARTTFAEVNGRVLEKPNVRLLVEDGRNRLLVNPTTYDVISIEVSSIWFAGAANLYSKEFYELVAERLEPGGVLQQWTQLHHTNERTMASVLGTVRAVFPHVVLAVVGHQGIILAAHTPLETSHEHMNRLEKILEGSDVLGDQRLFDFAKSLLLDEKGIDAFLRHVAQDYGMPASRLVSTDENLYLEYATPKLNVPSADDIPDTLAYLSRYRQRDILREHIKP